MSGLDVFENQTLISMSYIYIFKAVPWPLLFICSFVFISRASHRLMLGYSGQECAHSLQVQCVPTNRGHGLKLTWLYPMIYESLPWPTLVHRQPLAVWCRLTHQQHLHAVID